MKILKLNNYSDNKNNNMKGFTIIEVVLVLAIAGLIFLMVFLALPALQRAQRNEYRRTQARLIIDAINTQTSANRGKRSSNTLEGLIRLGYLKEEDMRDPSTGEVYTSDMNNWGGPLYRNYQNIPVGSYGWDTGGYCEGNNPVDVGGVNNYANTVFVIGLEGGWVCASNDMR